MMTQRPVIGSLRSSGMRRQAPPQPAGLPSDGAAPLGRLGGGLALDALGRDRPRFEPGLGDRLAALLARAEGAVVDAREGVADLADELALAVADAQLEVAVRLQHRPVGGIGEGL